MERKTTFFNTGIGILPVVAMMIAMFAGTIFVPMFFGIVNAQNVWMQVVLLAMIGCAVAVSVRAKGPDFSIAGVMALTMMAIGQFSTQGYGWEVGLVVALLIAAGVGALNGAVALYTPVPAPAITIVVFIVLRLLLNIFSTQPVPIEGLPAFGQSLLAATILLVLVVAAVFLFVFFSRLGTPFAGRQKGEKTLSYLFAYVISAVLSALAAFFLASRLGAAIGTVSWEYVMYTVFVAAGIYASK
ncbi:MAG: hypothetical protein VB081_12410, partial [Christensenella sp.]|uniref:hypothetical protein n=1 Tax=Christensenella sp. TaxID=1935934 RepID=UPI002B1F1FCF